MARLMCIVLLFYVNILIKANILPRAVNSFDEHELVPDVLSRPPAELLKITFPEDVEVKGGNILTISEVAPVPTFEWTFRSDSLYTVVMADADAPSRDNPEARSFLQWLVINIPRNDVGAGQTIINRKRSNPEPHTGLHRYYFLVYKQQGYVEFEEQESDSFNERVKFNPEEFGDKYQMDIIAGNFYQTENLDNELFK